MRELHRPPKSAAEIEALPSLGTTECTAHVHQHGHSFAPETLVYLLRETISARNTALVEMCAKFLLGSRDGDTGWKGGHCEGMIAKCARKFGFLSNRELLLAFRARCLSALWKAIYSGRERKPFWEERFGSAFKATCIDVARALRRPQYRDMEAGLAVDSEANVDVDDVDPGVELIDDVVLHHLSQPHISAAFAQALLTLPPRQRQALSLRYDEGRDVEGSGDATVAAIMGITPRAVYKHLEKGLAVLRADPGLRAIWDGEA